MCLQRYTTQKAPFEMGFTYIIYIHKYDTYIHTHTYMHNHTHPRTHAPTHQRTHTQKYITPKRWFDLYKHTHTHVHTHIQTKKEGLDRFKVSDSSLPGRGFMRKLSLLWLRRLLRRSLWWLGRRAQRGTLLFHMREGWRAGAPSVAILLHLCTLLHLSVLQLIPAARAHTRAHRTAGVIP